MNKKNKPNMTMQIVIAMVVGIAFGYFFPDAVAHVAFVGQVFLNLIQMGIVLLVLGQIVEAIGHLKISQLGTIGLKTVIAFGLSSLLAAAWGIISAVLFQPGAGIGNLVQTDTTIEAGKASSLQEVIVGFFPKNIMAALSAGSIAQIITFSIVFGIALSLFSENQESKLMAVLHEFNIVVLKMIGVIMTFAPIGIFALISSTVAQLGIAVVLPMLKYLLVYGAATFAFLLLWEVLVCLYCRVSLVTLTKKMMKMSIMALATTSSAVTLPTVIEDSEGKLGIQRDVSRLVLPLGMSLNSNGSAMHMALTVVTVAQIYGVVYGVTDYVFIAFLATLSSLANAVVPGAGLVSLSIVIPQMGLPVESIAIFAGVEWFVGMLRTILNVNSDTFCALLVAQSEHQIDRTVLEH